MADQEIVAVGDIHGCSQTLEALLDKLADYEDRLIVFIGDYIDRGPHSKKVVELLLSYQQSHECVFLRGNHEQMLLEALDRGDVDLWMKNGADATLDSYDTTVSDLTFPEEHVSFFRHTKMYYETDDYFFVHAGLPPDRTIEEAKQDEAFPSYSLWERQHLNAWETPWEKTVIFGHTSRSQPIKRAKMIGIDTGCAYTSLGYGKLTAVLLPEEEFVQQISLD